MFQCCNNCPCYDSGSNYCAIEDMDCQKLFAMVNAKFLTEIYAELVIELYAENIDNDGIMFWLANKLSKTKEGLGDF